MPKRNFILLQDFAERYDAKSNVIQVMKNQNVLPDEIFKKPNKNVYIDENFFIRRKEFAKKIWNKSHDNYYELIEKYSESSICKKIVNTNTSKRTLDSWRVFISNGLFQLQDDSITRPKVNKMLWEFFRATSRILREDKKEATIKDFNCIDDYYDYFEALRLKEALVA